MCADREKAGRYWKIFVPRLRCARCGVSHALLPAFTLAGRLDVAETIGSVVGEVMAGGVRGPPGGGAGGGAVFEQARSHVGAKTTAPNLDKVGVA